jgi:fatty acid desaturase
MTGAGNPFAHEVRIERALRSWPPLIPLVTLVTMAVLYLAICSSARRFADGHYWIAALSGLLVHAFLVVAVHDGAHRAVTRTRLDSVLMNVAAGLVLLPCYAEPFRVYHLTHHADTNGPDDPLWPSFKARLYARWRLLYMAAEVVPLGFQLYAVLARSRRPRSASAGRGVRLPYLLLSCTATLLVIGALRPNPAFVVATLASVSVWAALRHWCEHLGPDPSRESNTFSFPLGMGIGNHAAHHRYPRFSWLTMALGLWLREKDTNPLRSVLGMIRDPGFRHYERRADCVRAPVTGTWGALRGTRSRSPGSP